MQKLIFYLLAALAVVGCRAGRGASDSAGKKSGHETPANAATPVAKPDTQAVAAPPPPENPKPAPDEPFFVFPKTDGARSEVLSNLLREMSHSEVFAQGFTGFVLMEPETGEVLASVNGNKYFTPASNTKILTLYTCLKVLGDSLPGLQYHVGNEQVTFRATADPTFLHPDFQAYQPAFDFLKKYNQKLVCWQPRLFREKPLGPGWSWDDFSEDYSQERSECPVFGNSVRVSVNRPDASHPTTWLRAQPPRFERFIRLSSALKTGECDADRCGPDIYFGEGTVQRKNYQRDVPIRDVTDHWRDLLADSLGRGGGIGSCRNYVFGPWQTLRSWPLDTVLRRMFQESDNFLAEQLLLVCAGVKLDEFSAEKMIGWSKTNLLHDLPQRVKWVDGSGLSRYNLNTPYNNAWLLRKFWREFPRERIFTIFPAGGVSGTVADWYVGPGERPFVFAKTGTMGAVHCLSGYVVCASGKVLIFSYMHNNFPGSSRPYRKEMGRFLATIRENF